MRNTLRRRFRRYSLNIFVTILNFRRTNLSQHLLNPAPADLLRTITNLTLQPRMGMDKPHKAENLQKMKDQELTRRFAPKRFV